MSAAFSPIYEDPAERVDSGEGHVRKPPIGRRDESVEHDTHLIRKPLHIDGFEAAPVVNEDELEGSSGYNKKSQRVIAALNVAGLSDD